MAELLGTNNGSNQQRSSMSGGKRRDNQHLSWKSVFDDCTISCWVQM
ncbi:MAG: hypothetical protein IPO72_19985 [Saprospiraceae bacterium]|nr:hypothetical protein [Candidatus Vicinibacter affinis]